jgi:alkanesulfonate monooxygenase SsuD/methylene tetrahydromethanopterin reductase-like flavin-dependent oxidoreductase (luciferase family)
MRERVAALRSIWTEERPSLDGRFDRFSPAWVYPKPVQASVPIALGNAGRVGIAHAAEYADEWCPIDAQLLNDAGRPDVVGGIALFRRLAEEAGRDAAAVPITIFAFGRIDRERIESYAELGVQRIVFPPTTMNRHDERTALTRLDRLAPLVDDLRG